MMKTSKKSLGLHAGVWVNSKEVASISLFAFLWVMAQITARTLGGEAFLALLPVYLISTVKGLFLSVAGILLGNSILPRITLVLPQVKPTGKRISHARASDNPKCRQCGKSLKYLVCCGDWYCPYCQLDLGNGE